MVLCTLATMEDEPTLTEEQKEKEVIRQKELIYKQVEELKYSNAALLAENDMFEAFIGRMDPTDLRSQAVEDSLGAAGASQLEGEGRGRMWKTRSGSDISNRQLTLEQKLHVAQREVAETKQDQEKLKQRYEKLRDNYKASLEETEMRLAEIRRARNEFERKLLKPMKENGLRVKEPEKLLQFIEDKSKFTQLEKLNMKNQTLKAHKRKLQQQLLQKREAGKAEYEEFFQEYCEQRVEKTLDELQVNHLKVQRALSSHKEKLESVTLESTQLSRDISNRKQMLAKIEKEIQRAEEEFLKAEALNKHLRRQMTDYQAPDITEYMHVKDKHKRLQQSIHTWERRVAISQMVLRTRAKARSSVTAPVTPAHSAEAGVRCAGRVPLKLPCITEHST